MSNNPFDFGLQPQLPVAKPIPTIPSDKSSMKTRVTKLLTGPNILGATLAVGAATIIVMLTASYAYQRCETQENK